MKVNIINFAPTSLYAPKTPPVNDSGRYIETFLLTLHSAADNAQRSINSQKSLGLLDKPSPLHSLFDAMPANLTKDVLLPPEMKLATDTLLFSVRSYQGKVNQLEQGGFKQEAKKLSDMLQDIARSFNLPQDKVGTDITAYQKEPYSLIQLSAAINTIVWGQSIE